MCFYYTYMSLTTYKCVSNFSPRYVMEHFGRRRWTTIPAPLVSYSVHKGKHFLFQLWVDVFLSWFITGQVRLFGPVTKVLHAGTSHVLLLYQQKCIQFQPCHCDVFAGEDRWRYSKSDQPSDSSSLWKTWDELQPGNNKTTNKVL